MKKRYYPHVVIYVDKKGKIVGKTENYNFTNKIHNFIHNLCSCVKYARRLIAIEFCFKLL